MSDHELKQGDGQPPPEAVAQDDLNELHDADSHSRRESKGFTYGSEKGYSLRGSAGPSTEGDQTQEPSTAAGGGQGTALGKGTLRSETTEGEKHHGSQRSSGPSSGEGSQEGGQSDAPKQAGAHSAAPGSLESNPFPVGGMGADGISSKEAY